MFRKSAGRGLLAIAITAISIVSVRAATTVIPSTSLSSYSVFETYWAYLYPWGSDHNGSGSFSWLHHSIILLMNVTGARMVGNSTDHNHIAVVSNTLSLIATPTSNPVPPTSASNPHPAIHYARCAYRLSSGVIPANRELPAGQSTLNLKLLSQRQTLILYLVNSVPRQPKGPGLHSGNLSKPLKILLDESCRFFRLTVSHRQIIPIEAKLYTDTRSRL